MNTIMMKIKLRINSYEQYSTVMNATMMIMIIIYYVSYCRFNPNDDTDIAGFIATLKYYYDTHAA